MLCIPLHYAVPRGFGGLILEKKKKKVQNQKNPWAFCPRRRGKSGPFNAPCLQARLPAVLQVRLQPHPLRRKPTQNEGKTGKSAPPSEPGPFLCEVWPWAGLEPAACGAPATEAGAG